MNSTVVEDIRQNRADAMEKIMLYAYNYQHNFIEEAFADDPRIAEHFREKFNGSQFSSGTIAFVYLYLDMSKGYRDQLAKWIDENFKG